MEADLIQRTGTFGLVVIIIGLFALAVAVVMILSAIDPDEERDMESEDFFKD